MTTKPRRCALVVTLALIAAAIVAGCQGDGSLFGWIVQQDQPKPTTAAE